jgi:hypothetical protein
LERVFCFHVRLIRGCTVGLGGIPGTIEALNTAGTIISL